MIDLAHIHPMLVHFPLALLPVALALQGIALARGQGLFEREPEHHGPRHTGRRRGRRRDRCDIWRHRLGRGTVRRFFAIAARRSRGNGENQRPVTACPGRRGEWALLAASRLAPGLMEHARGRYGALCASAGHCGLWRPSSVRPRCQRSRRAITPGRVTIGPGLTSHHAERCVPQDGSRSARCVQSMGHTWPPFSAAHKPAIESSRSPTFVLSIA